MSLLMSIPPWSMHSTAAGVAATMLYAVSRVTHDPRAMHMPGSNYQKGFSSSSWQKTLFIFVINTAISIAEANTYEPLEVGTCDAKVWYSHSPKGLHGYFLELTFRIISVTGGHWLSLAMCIKYISSSRQKWFNTRVNLLGFSFMLSERKIWKKNNQGLTIALKTLLISKSSGDGGACKHTLSYG